MQRPREGLQTGVWLGGPADGGREIVFKSRPVVARGERRPSSLPWVSRAS